MGRMTRPLGSLGANHVDFAGIVLDPVIVPEFRWVQLVQSAWSIGLVGVLASIYPAVHAMHLDVAESMKFER